MTILRLKMERWVRLLRQMARNSRFVASEISPEAPDEEEGWKQHAQDLEELATHLEREHLSTPDPR